MDILELLLQIIGSLGLFLYGMKIMGEGIQKTAGDRLQRALNFMTGNRFVGVLTGFVVTAIIQSSSATTVMVVSFVNAGLLTLTQSIGVIMGANVGTTVTAWIVSLIGFKLHISALALPAIGIGFILFMAVKWGRKDLGEAILGFGILFLGLDFLTHSMPKIDQNTLTFISNLSNLGYVSVLMATLFGLGVTLLVHSSSASTAIFITMAHNGLINYPMAAGMILGANIGTTIDALLASIGTKAAARRAALVHLLFNVFGSVWALVLFRPFLALVDVITPGSAEGSGIATHLAMLHTAFNTINTLLFLPFVHPFARLVSFLVKDDPQLQGGVYRLPYTTASIQDTPELQILRAEKEIQNMAALVESMFEEFRQTLKVKQVGTVDEMVAHLAEKEDYADQMREELTRFLIECTRSQISSRSEQKVTQLMRIVADLEDMTDDCYSLGLTLQRSHHKKLYFNEKEMDSLNPYLLLVRDFLVFVREHLGKSLTEEELLHAQNLEEQIDQFRSKLKKLARKNIEAGSDVKTELLFIDLVRRIEKLGDYSYSITESLHHMGTLKG
ncbi:MAG: Na/Pi cotransporter family protein [Treponemataceae bacterium]|nr:Na/Pi cotransporter family protein [Treponemataceae bacterium]